MRRTYLLAATMLCGISTALADKNSEQILDDLNSAIEDLGRYEVHFDVENGGSIVANGEYFVDGELYKLTLADQEIYGDGESRYSVDKRLKEVVMESIDSSIPMVIANPARAFKELKKNFDSHTADNLTVELTPRKENEMIESAVIKVDGDSKLPISAKYISASESLTIKIKSFERSTKELISLENFPIPSGYEVIDIR